MARPRKYNQAPQTAPEADPISAPVAVREEPKTQEQTPASAEQPADEQPALAQGYSVTSIPDSFWRCSREFTKKATRFAPGELSPREIEILSNEPKLKIEAV